MKIDPGVLDAAKVLGGAALGTGASGLFGWLTKRAEANAPPNVTAAAAKLQEAVNTAAKDMLADLRREVDDLRKEVGELKAQNLTCEQENRGMAQRLSSLESILDRAGIDWKKVTEPGALLVVEHGKATVTRPGDPLKA